MVKAEALPSALCALTRFDNRQNPYEGKVDIETCSSLLKRIFYREEPIAQDKKNKRRADCY
jgi:hypothetical protein